MQDPSLHFSTSVVGHCWPPSVGSLVIFGFLFLIPGPQVSEQAVHSRNWNSQSHGSVLHTSDSYSGQAVPLHSAGLRILYLVILPPPQGTVQEAFWVSSYRQSTGQQPKEQFSVSIIGHGVPWIVMFNLRIWYSCFIRERPPHV